MSATTGLRARKKAMTHAAIQKQALRLFLVKGYNNTTVDEIAAAAGVSHMTFFRYFPTKEDVVLSDTYDPLIAEQISARPAHEPVIEKVRHALLHGLNLVYAANRDLLLARTRLILDTPALRARLWEQQHATERMIASALAASRANADDRDKAGNEAGNEAGDTPAEKVARDLDARVVTAACLAAVTTAVEMWAEGNGTPELPALIDHALTALQHELSATHGERDE